MSKSAVASTTAPGHVDYTVTVYNKKAAGPVHNGVLTDTLFDPEGEVMYTRSWNLDTLVPGDEIKLTYTVAFATSTEAGTYRNVAEITGRNKTADGKKISVEGYADISFGTEGHVLGVATSTPSHILPVETQPKVCEPFITSFMRPGSSNNSGDVLKLQVFLNVAQHAGLPTTGFFGPKTLVAVNTFQRTYASEILHPAGLSAPTGNVYALTLQKINALYCGTSPVAPITAAPPRNTVRSTSGAPTAPSRTTAPARSSAPKTTVKKTTTSKPASPPTATRRVEQTATLAPTLEHAQETQSSTTGGFMGWLQGLFGR